MVLTRKIEHYKKALVQTNQVALISVIAKCSTRMDKETTIKQGLKYPIILVSQEL